jgi:hypothetical protein
MNWYIHKNSCGQMTVHGFAQPGMSACRRLKKPNGDQVELVDYPGIVCGECKIAANRLAKRVALKVREHAPA